MQALDTNVVVRILVRDDEDQGRRAEATLREAIASGGAWIPTVVLVEVSWVLRVAYKFDRFAIAAALRRLVSTAGIVAEDGPGILRAVSAYEGGPADFADYVILERARGAEALPLRTFDELLARADGVSLVR